MSQSTTMAELLAQHKSSLQTLTRGQIVTGTVKKVTPGEILLDINAKTEAVVMEKDRRLLKQLLAALHVGDKVEASVISPESEMGYPVVSLRGFVGGKMWEELEALQKSGKKIEVIVTEATRGGFLVESSTGLSGFLPNSHVTIPTNAADLVGQKLQVSIVELSRENKKVVFSQKGVLSADDFKKIADMYKAGKKVTGKVSGITTFGIFISLPVSDTTTVDGLIHISEISWEKTEDVASLFTQGQEVEAVVIGTDKDSKRIDLSIKRLSKDPFEEIVAAFPVDKKVSGVVTDVNENGVMLDLGEVGDTSVEGMIKKDKISPDTKYEVGQNVKVTVTSIDARRRRVMLTPVLLEKPLMYR